MIRSLITCLLVACLLAPLAARAADPDSTVSSMGTGTIEKQAEIMRLQMEVQTEGPTLKEALANLKTRRETIKAALVKLGALEGSYEGGEPRVVEADTNSRAAMERMMRERMNGGGTKPAAGGPKTVSVTCSLRIDWALKGASAEENLVAGNAIKEQIKASKVLDVPKNAAQQEVAEEAAAEAASNNEGPAANEAMFMYVAKISDAEQAKATADAFAKAKQSAARLAKAAGGELGAVRVLNSSSGSSSMESMYSDYYGGGSSSRYYYQRMMAERARSTDVNEAFSAQPGKVTQDVVVQASFTLK